MDVVVPSICLSSVAGALLFYAGGRLSARALPEAPSATPLEPEIEAERGARSRAEAEAAGAWRSHRDAVAALAEERSRSTALREELAGERDARARADAEAASERHRLVDEGAKLREQIVTLRASLASARLPAAAPPPDPARAARLREAEVRAAGAESRVHELGAELSKANADLHKATASTLRLAGEVAALHTRAVEHGREAARLTATRAAAEALEAEAQLLRADNDRLRRAVSALERERGDAPDLATTQRQRVETTIKLRALEQRAEEITRCEEANAELRRRVEALAGAAAEAEALRREVRDLTAQGFARRAAERRSPSEGEIPDAEGMLVLEASLELGLRELCKREPGCRTAVLSDVGGLLIAAYGDPDHRDEMAAASSLMTYLAERLRELVPVGEPTSLALVDENEVVFRTRWLRREDECFLVSTLGAAPPADARGVGQSPALDRPIEVLRVRLAELLGAR